MRVALFTDSFHETNGVGTFSREYASYARRGGFPFFCAYGGREARFSETGSLRELELRRGPFSFGVDSDVSCDPFLGRFRSLTVSRLRAFRPDIVHITGPGDVSVLGFWAANLVGCPTIASWHTNLHDYASRRLQSSCGLLPCAMRNAVSAGAGGAVLRALTSWYRLSHFVAAPNLEMVKMLEERTRRPSYLMAHGVDTTLFAPERRRRTDAQFRIGYVGRLTPEKNVRALAALERGLFEAGERDFRMMVVGEGSEREWLRANLKTAELTGVLTGDALAAAFADLDVLVFPSLTDTFGLVILEAMSSGVPVIVAPDTGTRAGVCDGESGFLSQDFTASVLRLMRCSATRLRMRACAREHALARGWCGVFDGLHQLYQDGLATKEVRRRMPTPKFDA